MDPAKLKAAIEAIKANDGEAALTILEEMLVSGAAGDAGDTGAADAGTTTTTETPAAGGSGGGTTPADEQPKQNALPDWLFRIAGTTDPVEAEARVSRVVKRGLEADRHAGAVELAERRSLIGDLVTLGIETPSTAWQGEPEKRVPSARLAGQPLAELRSYVAEMKKLRGTRSDSSEVTPPESETESDETIAAEVKKLSAPVLDQIKQRGMTPEQFIKARNRATHRVTVPKK